MNGTPHSVGSNPSRSMSFSANGVNRAANNTRIDGASATNVWLPHIASYVPALESIETVNIVTNSFDAEQGLVGGAAVTVQVRSGTNDLHGAGFWYHLGNWSQSRPFFQPANQQKHVFGHDHRQKIRLRVAERAQQCKLSPAFEYVPKEDRPEP